MKTSNEVSNIFAAQIAMQQELQDIGKDSKGYGYNYTSFESLTRYLRPLLTKHGLGFIQTSTNVEDRIGVCTRLIHKSGEWVEDTFTVPLVGLAKMNDYQVAGSAITYLKRYGLSAIVGIASDEDADAHGEQTKPQQKAPPPSKATDGEQTKLLNEFKAKLEAYNIDPRKFLERDGVDMKDTKQVYATVRQYMGMNNELFQNVLENWEE